MVVTSQHYSEGVGKEDVWNDCNGMLTTNPSQRHSVVAFSLLYQPDFHSSTCKAFASIIKCSNQHASSIESSDSLTMLDMADNVLDNCVIMPMKSA